MSGEHDLPGARPEAAAWAPQRTADGSWTLVHPRHGEACHNLDGAWLEARERYAGACRLRECGREARGSEVRLLDLGTGLGWNVAAALAALDGTGARLACVTMERDPAVLAAMLALHGRGEGGAAARETGPGERFHAAVRAALARALARGAEGGAEPAEMELAAGDGGTLRLVLGDAREAIRALSPGLRFDAVFLDPFSPANEPELWEPEFLGDVARVMASDSLLSTYSAAFRVRLALARAGLRVGAGPRVGRKREGTLASPDRAVPALTPRVARRLVRALGPERPILGPVRRERPTSID